jgi:hypothetical protein
MTTFNSYGHVEDHRQAEIIKGLGEAPEENPDLKALFDKFISAARRK